LSPHNLKYICALRSLRDKTACRRADTGVGTNSLS